MEISFSDREKYLSSLCETLFKEHDSWVESDEESLSLAFIQAAQKLVEGFGQGAIPESMRRLELQVSQFAKIFSAVSMVDLIDSANDSYIEFWSCFEELRKTFFICNGSDCPVKENIPAIDELRRQGSPDAQICRLYGFMKNNHYGEWVPDLEKLNEEEQSPGKWTGNNWKSPAALQKENQQKQASDNIAKINKKRDLKNTRKKTNQSIDELIAEGVSLRQIANMKGVSVERIKKYAEEKNLEYKEDYFDIPDPEVVSEIITIHKDFPDLPYREIAERVSRDGNEIDWQTVKKIIQKDQ